MEKYIIRWSYWLGVISFLVAIVWRVLIVAVGKSLGFGGLTYMSFYKGALLLLSTAIATACYAWFKAQKQ
jgi:hypothetical protein